MENVTEEKRVEAYRNAKEEIRLLYSSDALTHAVNNVYEKYGISAHYKVMSEIVGDAILGFHKIADIPRLFQQKLQVSADESQRMISQLIEILKPVIEREEEEAQIKKEEVAKLAQTFSQPNPERMEFASTEMVEPIRTMAEDMNRVHGYGAYRQQQEEAEKDQPFQNGDENTAP